MIPYICISNANIPSILLYIQPKIVRINMSKQSLYHFQIIKHLPFQ